MALARLGLFLGLVQLPHRPQLFLEKSRIIELEVLLFVLLYILKSLVILSYLISVFLARNVRVIRKIILECFFIEFALTIKALDLLIVLIAVAVIAGIYVFRSLRHFLSFPDLWACLHLLLLEIRYDLLRVVLVGIPRGLSA